MDIDKDGYVLLVDPDGQDIKVHAIDARGCINSGYKEHKEVESERIVTFDYAVMRVGKKRALRVFDTLEQAEDYLQDCKYDCYIEERER